jgi:hypothetical protein
MNNLLKVIKYEKLKYDISDDDIELLFKYIDLNIVQHWIDHNYLFSYKDYPRVKNFFIIQKNERISGCTSLQSLNWSLFSPIDHNVVFDQLKYLQLLKLSAFI